MPPTSRDDHAFPAPEKAFPRNHGLVPPPAGCQIGWQPSALTPVFYGFRDYNTAQGAPSKLRVFFPSLEGSVADAPILQGCGHYPVILFAHGHCDRDADHYLKWFRLPAQLARSGYVVVVPQLPNIAVHPSGEHHQAQQTLADALLWIRQRWEHRGTLMPALATGLVGHSYGALHAGILATKTDVAAVASLSGEWSELPTDERQQILQVALPRLFAWGTNEGRFADSLWNEIAPPKHRAAFAGGEHWDYLYTQQIPCRGDQGPCRYMGAVTDDLVAMFFAKYLPPESCPDLPDHVPESLVPPALRLTPEQELYAGGHLIGMKLLRLDAQCGVVIDRDFPNDRIVPSVLLELRDVAEREIRDSDLVPTFTGPIVPGAWVFSQSPQPGAKVQVGSGVRMSLRVGPIH